MSHVFMLDYFFTKFALFAYAYTVTFDVLLFVNCQLCCIGRTKNIKCIKCTDLQFIEKVTVISRKR